MNTKPSAGMALRRPYIDALARKQSCARWLEATTENFLGLSTTGPGPNLDLLLSMRALYPVALHGVALNLGSTDPLDELYLTRLATLVRIMKPLRVSDHLCWTGVGGKRLHDLLPVPFTAESLAHVAARIDAVQERIRMPIAIENVSSYFEYAESTMTEWDFLAALIARTGCKLVLDVNNVYVSAVNHGFDPLLYLRALPPQAVTQYHLAGHSKTRLDGCTFLVDTHDTPVCAEVWALFDQALTLIGPRDALVERDDHFPPFAEIEAETAAIERRLHGIERKLIRITKRHRHVIA
jgi:uncharacterized protein (UPF0276 family)